MYKHISIESLKNLEIIDADLVSQMMNIFLSEFPDQIKSIQILANEKTSYEFGRRIHALKGSISVFGCSELCKLLKQIELLAKDEKFEDSFKIYTVAVKQIDEFVAEIQLFLKNLKNSAA